MKSKLDAKLEIEVKDAKGKVLNTYEKASDLVLDQFLQCVGSLLIPYMNTNILRVVHINGASTSRYIYMFGEASFARSDTQFQIQIGTSDKEPSPLDYRLGNPIATSGDLRPSIWSNPSIGTFQAVFETTFSFTQETIVRECGLVHRTLHTVPGVLFLRDLIIPPRTIPAGGTLTVRYIITTVTSR